MSRPKLTLILGIVILALFFTLESAAALEDANAGVLEILEATVYPETFSPNGDGVDDLVTISAKASKEVEWSVRILDPYGQDAAGYGGHGTSFSMEWDGWGVILASVVPDGNCVIYIQAKDSEGKIVDKTLSVDVIESETPKTTPIPTSTPTPTFPPSTPEPVELPSITDFKVSTEVITSDGDGVDDVVKISAVFSKKVHYKVEVRDTKDTSFYLTVGDGTSVEATWDGYVPLGDLTPAFELASCGLYKLTVYGDDEFGNGVIESAVVEVKSSEMQTCPEPEPPSSTGEPVRTPGPLQVLDYIEVIDVSHEIFSPNGDGIDDVTVITAIASEEVEWIVYVKDTEGRDIQKIWGGKDTHFRVKWDGLDMYGELVGDGKYILTVRARGAEGAEEREFIVKVVGVRPPTTLPPPPYTMAPPLPEVPPEVIEECIRELSKEPGITLEEVEKMCMVVVSPNIEDRRMRECFGELAREPGMTLEEVERLCTVMSIEPKEYCLELEKKLIFLAREIEGASLMEQESLQKDIETIKMEMLPCELSTRALPLIEVEAPIMIMNPCAEAHELEMVLEDMEKHRVVLKEMAVKGEVEEEELDDFDREMEYLRGRLEKTLRVCNQEETAVVEVVESPCSKLASLTSIYREIKDMEASAGVEEYERFKKKLDALAQEISMLKDRCRKADLTIEEVGSFGDVEKVYATKLKVSIEGASNEDLMGELTKIEGEKRKLIEEFTSKLQELELKEIRIIKKLKIEGGEVSLDDIKVTVPKVKIEVKGIEVELRPKGRGVEIVEGDVVVKTKVNLEYSNNTLRAMKSGRPIKVLPSELTGIVKGEVGEVEMVDEDVPKYIVISREKGKILGVVSVTLTKESHVNAEDGSLISEDKPWWSFLVFQ